MSDPTPQFEQLSIDYEEVVQLFIVASINRESLENPGPLFEAARDKFIAWVTQEQERVMSNRFDHLEFDVRRISLAIRGGMKEYARDELYDFESRLWQDSQEASFPEEAKKKFQGELDRFRIELA